MVEASYAVVHIHATMEIQRGNVGPSHTAICAKRSTILPMTVRYSVMRHREIRWGFSWYYRTGCSVGITIPDGNRNVSTYHIRSSLEMLCRRGLETYLIRIRLGSPSKNHARECTRPIDYGGLTFAVIAADFGLFHVLPCRPTRLQE